MAKSQEQYIFTYQDAANKHNVSKQAISYQARINGLGRKFGKKTILLTKSEVEGMKFREPNKKQY